jgi:hypothetical protein
MLFEHLAQETLKSLFGTSKTSARGVNKGDSIVILRSFGPAVRPRRTFARPPITRPARRAAHWRSTKRWVGNGSSSTTYAPSIHSFAAISITRPH